MCNVELAGDYVTRAKIRLAFVYGLFEEETWLDVVRESHKILGVGAEGVAAPVRRRPAPGHAVSGVLLAGKDRLPVGLIGEVEVLAAASRTFAGTANSRSTARRI